MKIFVSALCFDGGKSGISEYIRCLSAALEKRTKIVVAILRKDVPHFGVVGDNVELLILPNIFSWVGFNVLLHCLLVPLLCRLRCVDACILPAANRRLALWKTVPTVGIVHDLSQYHVHGKYDIWRTLYVKFVLPRFLAVLDDIICISETTKTDVVKFWHVDEDRISVIHNGYNSTLYSSLDPEEHSLIRN